MQQGLSRKNYTKICAVISLDGYLLITKIRKRMAKNESLNLGYLGYSFQVKLVKQLVEDHKFSESIVQFSIQITLTMNI